MLAIRFSLAALQCEQQTASPRGTIVYCAKAPSSFSLFQNDVQFAAGQVAALYLRIGQKLVQTRFDLTLTSANTSAAVLIVAETVQLEVQQFKLKITASIEWFGGITEYSLKTSFIDAEAQIALSGVKTVGLLCQKMEGTLLLASVTILFQVQSKPGAGEFKYANAIAEEAVNLDIIAQHVKIDEVVPQSAGILFNRFSDSKCSAATQFNYTSTSKGKDWLGLLPLEPGDEIDKQCASPWVAGVTIIINNGDALITCDAQLCQNQIYKVNDSQLTKNSFFNAASAIQFLFVQLTGSVVLTNTLNNKSLMVSENATRLECVRNNITVSGSAFTETLAFVQLETKYALSMINVVFNLTVTTGATVCSLGNVNMTLEMKYVIIEGSYNAQAGKSALLAQAIGTGPDITLTYLLANISSASFGSNSAGLIYSCEANILKIDHIDVQIVQTSAASRLPVLVHTLGAKVSSIVNSQITSNFSGLQHSGLAIHAINPNATQFLLANFTATLAWKSQSEATNAFIYATYGVNNSLNNVTESIETPASATGLLTFYSLFQVAVSMTFTNYSIQGKTAGSYTKSLQHMLSCTNCRLQNGVLNAFVNDYSTTVFSSYFIGTNVLNNISVPNAVLADVDTSDSAALVYQINNNAMVNFTALAISASVQKQDLSALSLCFGELSTATVKFIDTNIQVTFTGGAWDSLFGTPSAGQKISIEIVDSRFDYGASPIPCQLGSNSKITLTSLEAICTQAP